MKKRLGAVILAAGAAQRMGCQKLMLPLAGVPLIAHVLRTVSSLCWADCLVVIGQPREPLTAVCRQYSLHAVYNPERLSGQASSIGLALRHLAPDLDGVLFLPGDQPLITVDLIQALVERFATLDNQHIVAPCYRGQCYSPVLFGACWRAALAALTGDVGGRVLLRQHPEFLRTVEWTEGHSFMDADTWEQYQQLCKFFHG